MLVNFQVLLMIVLILTITSWYWMTPPAVGLGKRKIWLKHPNIIPDQFLCEELNVSFGGKRSQVCFVRYQHYESYQMISPDRLCDTTDLKRSFPLDTCEMVMVMVMVMVMLLIIMALMMMALLLDIYHMFILMIGQRMMIIDRDLKVTTACKVVLLPSSHPFGKIPGEPQLISDHHFHVGFFCCLFHFWIIFFCVVSLLDCFQEYKVLSDLYRWVEARSRPCSVRTVSPFHR